MLRKHRVLIGAMAPLVAGSLLAGCGFGGELSISCRNFLEQPEGEQARLMALWTEQDGVVMEEMRGSVERDNLTGMREHCGRNPEDKLSQLESSYGFGY